MRAARAPECVPTTPNAGDPRREITISFDDRRRLEDRVYRLRTAGARMVRSNFLISEFRRNTIRWLNGWWVIGSSNSPAGNG